MAIFKWLQEIKDFFAGHRWLVIVSVGSYVIYKVVRKCYRESRLPPGPAGWPWIGYADCLGGDAFNKIQLLCRKYGPVISFRVCGKLIVILSDEKSIMEAAFKNRQLIGRHTMLTNHVLAKGHGISNYDEENALSLRRIFVRAICRILPDVNRGKALSGDPITDQITSIERTIIDEKLDVECDKLLKYLRQANGEPLKIGRMAWHIMWKAAFGIDCQLDDATITRLMQCVAENNSQNGPFQFKQMLPNFLSKILTHSRTARKILGINEIWDRYERITSVLSQSVAELRSVPNRNKECLLSAFLDSEKYTVSEPDAGRLAFEIMAAGIDTTTLTLVWCCYALSIGKVVLKPGEAFMESHLEVVHRLASVVPMALPHYTRLDGYVGGYLIPKDSIVFYNLYAVHQAQLDRALVEKNPAGICPFAEKDNSKLKRYLCESAMPFSVGSRACPGFMFATRMILRIINNIITEFRIVEVRKHANLTEDHLNGLTRPPVNETYRFVKIS